MPNDLLIDRLVSDLKPVRRRRSGRDGLMLALLAGLELGLFLWLGALRPDMRLALEAPSFWWKLVSFGLIAMVSAAVAVRSFDPVHSPRRGLRGVMALVAAAVVCGGLVDAGQSALPGLVARLHWPDGLQCVASIVLLSLPPVIALGVLMRQGAPTDRGGTALAVGLAAAAWAAFVYMFSCNYDDPLYVGVWYALGCGCVILAARWVLPRLTRW